MKLILKRRLWATSLLLASFASRAAEQAYKMVVIAEDPLAAMINSAAADKVALEPQADLPAGLFARQMNLCVLYSKQQRWQQATTACHQAVTAGRNTELKVFSSQRELRSYAYNNRGVAKSLTGDQVGALADFQRADALTDNDLIRHNLQKLTAELNSSTLVAMKHAAAPK